VLLLTKVQPDLVCIGTPKAGLLGGLAALISRVPRRLLLLRGLRSEGMEGLASRFVTFAERVSAACANSVVCVSPSLQSAAVRSGVVREGASVVLGSGSSNGVSEDIIPTISLQRQELRSSTFEQPDCFTLGYVGRVTRDKGLDTLAAALGLLSAAGIVGNCLVIGGDDSKDGPGLRAALDSSGWSLVHTGALTDALPLLGMVDALCLPSRREGFPNVVLEAAMLGIATIGSDATGVVDAVVHEVTGLVFPIEDDVALADAISSLERDPARCSRLGARARLRAAEEFARPRVWERQEHFFRNLLEPTEERDL
jgi:glycosyltransferase involved in cell wall biosynthesis